MDARRCRQILCMSAPYELPWRPQPRTGDKYGRRHRAPSWFNGKPSHGWRGPRSGLDGKPPRWRCSPRSGLNGRPSCWRAGRRRSGSGGRRTFWPLVTACAMAQLPGWWTEMTRRPTAEQAKNSTASCVVGIRFGLGMEDGRCWEKEDGAEE
uniref:Uncharacterized protein n=1 Tax=Aegilops tauschii TaxID=37682 RepID=N1R2Y8_AEGTA